MGPCYRIKRACLGHHRTPLVRPGIGEISAPKRRQSPQDPGVSLVKTPEHWAIEPPWAVLSMFRCRSRKQRNPRSDTEICPQRKTNWNWELKGATETQSPVARTVPMSQRRTMGAGEAGEVGARTGTASAGRNKATEGKRAKPWGPWD